MYDVLYLDRKRTFEVVGEDLDLDAATTLARAEARARHVGRMFLAGSEVPASGRTVLIVEHSSHLRAA